MVVRYWVLVAPIQASTHIAWGSARNGLRSSTVKTVGTIRLPYDRLSANTVVDSAVHCIWLSPRLHQFLALVGARLLKSL